MARLPYRCAIISVCLAGALLLLPICSGLNDDQYNFDYDSTQSPEYFFNSTFDYSAFISLSNISSEELEKFLIGGGTYTGGDTNITETETDGSVQEEKPTEPTIFVFNKASRSAPVCFLFTLILMVHQILRLL